MGPTAKGIAKATKTKAWREERQFRRSTVDLRFAAAEQASRDRYNETGMLARLFIKRYPREFEQFRQDQQLNQALLSPAAQRMPVIPQQRMPVVPADTNEKRSQKAPDVLAPLGIRLD